MRKAAAIILALTLALCGCEGNGIKRTEANNRAKPAVSGRFLCDDNDYEFETVVDSRTGVTYLVWNNTKDDSTTRVGGITVLLNRDGTPVISEEVNE